MSLCWCEVLGADRCRAYSTVLHCISLRHAALEVFLAFAGHSAVEGARFLRGGDACMQSVCDLADRGVHSPVSLERHAEVMNRKY